jgi:transcriptional regulator with XRE-family HTH domain
MYKIKVKEVRLKLGLTQEEFAQKFHISLSYYKKIESGARVPSINWLDRVAEKLNVPFTDLLS